MNIPNRGLIIINESGLYSLIFSSKLPAAKMFKQWVTKEVLPTMRKLGFDDSLQVLKNELIKKENKIRSLQQDVSDLHLNLLAKDSEVICTTAWVVYNPNLTPGQKQEAMVFDPGEDLDYIKMRNDMTNIENGLNYYPCM